MSSPLIGIPSFYDTTSPDSMPPRFAMSRPYITALEMAGAIPVIIPLALSETTLRSLYERIDGLFMAGGGDLNQRPMAARRIPRQAALTRCAMKQSCGCCTGRSTIICQFLACVAALRR